MGTATLPTIEEIRNRWAERGQLADGAWHPRHTRPDDGRTDLVADMCARDVAVLLAEVERLRVENEQFARVLEACLAASEGVGTGIPMLRILLMGAEVEQFRQALLLARRTATSPPANL